MCSPGATAAAATRSSAGSAAHQRGLRGAADIRPLIARRARSRLRASRSWASEKSTTVDAPSPHSPMTIAPITATVMSAFMSRLPCRSRRQPVRAMGAPPTRMAAR